MGIECTGCGAAGEPEHECPFQADVYDDTEFSCNCCEDCAENCAMEV